MLARSPLISDCVGVPPVGGGREGGREGGRDGKRKGGGNIQSEGKSEREKGKR